ncbi:MAG: DUF1385 domain-containing protein [Chloroflexota bacterium]|nr:DUF1385 domain-containing protein [Chloroflexota bacterium]
MQESKKRDAGELKFSYGGQAVIEGVMMRGAHSMAVAVRNPKGEIVIHEQPLSARLYRGRIARTPFLRGLIGLWDALGLGIRALMWSADVALDEEEDISFNGPIGWATIAVSLLIGVGIFFLLPTATATGIGNLLGLSASAPEIVIDADGNEIEVLPESTNILAYEALPVGIDAFLINLIEGVVQLSILVVYIWFVGRTKDGRRIFAYHGAEHKTINAYEAGDDLLPEIVSRHAIEHPRCGTAFLLTVVFVSVLLFSLIGRPPFALLILSRVIFIPVIAGVAYEFLKYTASNLDKAWIRFMIRPNLALQHLTTNEPSLDMIEVSIVSFKRVLLSEGILREEEATIPEPRPEAAHSPGSV